MEQDNLPGTLGNDGEVEIVDEVTEFHKGRAIQHTDEADRHLGMSLLEYIAAGEHLWAVRKRMDWDDFLVWIEKPREEGGYYRSRKQAEKYMRLSLPENKQTILGISEDLRPTTLKAALELLSGSEDKPKKNGKRKEDDLGAKLARQKELADKRLADRKEAEEKAKELQRKLRDASRGRKEVEKEITQEVERHYLAELAEVKARYGDETQPTFADVSPEVWAEAMRKAKDQRVIDVTKMLNDLYELPSWMGEYFPDEAAEAIMDMEKGEQIVEGFEFFHDWVGKLLQEVQQRVT
jgi:hypothetical protein